MKTEDESQNCRNIRMQNYQDVSMYYEVDKFDAHQASKSCRKISKVDDLLRYLSKDGVKKQISKCGF